MSDDYIKGGTLKPDWIRDPDTQQLLPIEKDRSWLDAMNAFHATACPHERSEPMKVRIADGRMQVMQCCVVCGQRSGSAMSQKDRAWVDALCCLPRDVEEDYQARREREKRAVLLRLARAQYAERGRFTQSYRSYLASPEWHSLRSKVLKRCAGICEGCGERPANEVHHLTYRHFTEEFLFELVALCSTCHDRWHAQESEEEPQGEMMS